MGLFDLPVSELYNYQGLNPKPDDFDAYWQRALDEMNALDPSVALEPAYVHPAFECDDLYFTGTGGARIYAKFVIPKKAVFPVPAVLTFHGYTGSSADWSFLFNIAASGYAVAALDARGQGGKSEDVGKVRGNTCHGQIIRSGSSAFPAHFPGYCIACENCRRNGKS